jgi:hypothetical protein
MTLAELQTYSRLLAMLANGHAGQVSVLHSVGGDISQAAVVRSRCLPTVNLNRNLPVFCRSKAQQRHRVVEAELGRWCGDPHPLCALQVPGLAPEVQQWVEGACKRVYLHGFGDASEEEVDKVSE